MRRTLTFQDDGGSDGGSRRGTFHFTPHAYERIQARGLSANDIISAVASAIVIEDYSDSRPHPTRLLLTMTRRGPLHVVISERLAQGVILVVTAYEPSPEQWHPGFRRRR